MINKQEFKFIRDLHWEEVFIFWYENEGHKENWINLAKERGYNSWADWRLSSYADKFECQKVDWGLYEIQNAPRVIADFYGGPFRTWVENYYEGQETKSFAELIKNSEVKNKTAVQAMSLNFPVDKKITFLQLQDRIYVIEGMHRCCALALMNEKGIELSKPLQVIIGRSHLAKLPVVGKNK